MVDRILFGNLILLVNEIMDFHSVIRSEIIKMHVHENSCLVAIRNLRN